MGILFSRPKTEAQKSEQKINEAWNEVSKAASPILSHLDKHNKSNAYIKLMKALTEKADWTADGIASDSVLYTDYKNALDKHNKLVETAKRITREAHSKRVMGMN